MNIRTKDGKRIVKLTQVERKTLRAFASLLEDFSLVQDVQSSGLVGSVQELVEKYDKDEVVL